VREYRDVRQRARRIRATAVIASRDSPAGPYGAHLAPMRIRAAKTAPRHPGPTSIESGRSPARRMSPRCITRSRPQIVASALGSPMNMLLALGIYAARTRAREPLRFQVARRT
jgi:hypothetical protein